jgi:hypothetical protein
MAEQGRHCIEHEPALEAARAAGRAAIILLIDMQQLIIRWSTYFAHKCGNVKLISIWGGTSRQLFAADKMILEGACLGARNCYSKFQLRKMCRGNACLPLSDTPGGYIVAYLLGRKSTCKCFPVEDGASSNCVAPHACTRKRFS